MTRAFDAEAEARRVLDAIAWRATSRVGGSRAHVEVERALRAAHAAGAENMRERAKRACHAAVSARKENRMRNDGALDCATLIDALPLTEPDDDA